MHASRLLAHEPRRPVIITCAISGALADREQCPAIRYTPPDHAAEARRRRRDRQALDRHRRRARRRAGRLPARPQARRRRAEHGLDELREPFPLPRGVFQTVFADPFHEIIELLAAMNELGIRPEHECYIGCAGSLAPLLDMGVLRAPLQVDCVMGVTGGIPATARNLAAMVDDIPAGAHRGVIGISRAQWTLGV